MVKRIIPDNYENVCIKKVYDPDGSIVKMYDSDERVLIGRVEDDYSEREDMRNMLELIGKTESTKERNTVFIENLYEIDRIGRY